MSQGALQLFLYIETVHAFCVTIVRCTIRHGPLASSAPGTPSGKACISDKIVILWGGAALHEVLRAAFRRKGKSQTVFQGGFLANAFRIPAFSSDRIRAVTI